MSLFRLIPQSDWSTIDDAVWAQPGDVVDLGCHPWDWSKAFFGKKRVIGVDPFAESVPEAELYRGVIGMTDGETIIDVNNDASTCFRPVASTVKTPMLTWRSFRAKFDIQQIALLKINIEGSEYALLDQMSSADFEVTHQIAVSFHDFCWPDMRPATNRALALLTSTGYSITPTCPMWGWYHCIRK